MSAREIEKVGDDRFKIELADQVRQLLLDLKEMTLTHVVSESPIAKRIFPTAYNNSPEMELDFEKLTREPLMNHHQENLSLFERSLFKNEINQEEVLAWISALNNMRLILGTALDIQEDQEIPKETDPNYEGYLVYDLITYLQGALIEEIQR
ncbi:MAG: DUF2017 domain-containing protein [Actinobacteria bacterium]|jgi:hypothetical protein|nr:DUF2017 domain-containing protein [Actinomycetota bacterium]